MIDIRLPNITATTEAGQLAQMRSYLYQFSEQLQWALGTLEKGVSANEVLLKNAVGEIVEKTEEAKAQDTFNSIKDLIIKSADIVKAYYEEIDLLYLKGNYVAESDFGTYKEETANSIQATSDAVTAKFTKTEVIDGEVVQSEYSLDDIDSRLRKQEGTIRFGSVTTTLTPDRETIGIEIGEIDTINDTATKRFAVFSAAGIELYGGSSTPVATISQSKITITSAEFDGYLKLGKYRVDLSRGIAFKWEG